MWTDGLGWTDRASRTEHGRSTDGARTLVRVPLVGQVSQLSQQCDSWRVCARVGRSEGRLGINVFPFIVGGWIDLPTRKGVTIWARVIALASMLPVSAGRV